MLNYVGHSECVAYMKTFNKPLLLLGGGGYTVRNVSRCWANETSVALGMQLSDDIPYNLYYEYYGPDFTLNITPSNMENQNTPKYLIDQQTTLLQMLDSLPHRPSIQYTTTIPRDNDALTEYNEMQEEKDENDRLDNRMTLSSQDKSVLKENDYFDDDNHNNDNAYQTKGTHNNSNQVDQAQQFYDTQNKLINQSIQNNNDMDTS